MAMQGNSAETLGLLYEVHAPVSVQPKNSLALMSSSPHNPTSPQRGTKCAVHAWQMGKPGEVSSHRGNPRWTGQPRHITVLAAEISSLPSEVLVVA